MKLLNISYVPDQEIEALGIVKGGVVQGASEVMVYGTAVKFK